MSPDDEMVERISGSGGVHLSATSHGGPDGAPAIVLVHGYPDDQHMWDLVVPHLVTDHRVITYDVRGAGDSVAPTRRSGYRLEHLVADLEAVADATVPGEPIHLVGHDWGSIGAWAAVLDADASRRIASYTSLSGPPLEHISAWIARQRRTGRWGALLRQAVKSWYIAAFHTPLAPLAWRYGFASRWPQMLSRSGSVHVDAHWPGPQLLRNALNGIELYRANMIPSLREPRATVTDVPVQQIVANRDPFVTPELLDGLEAIAPDLVRVEMSGGHWLARSHPEQLATHIAEHVRRVSSVGDHTASAIS